MQLLRTSLRKMRAASRRYPLITFAGILGLALVGGSLLFSSRVQEAAGRTQANSFDTARVLPQAVTPPAANTQTFDAQSIKQYDGKDGRACYVAVKGVVYEIAGKGQWRDGGHLPSNGQAYCGADLTQAIGRSPHGESKLQELPKVGTYKD